MQRYSLHLILVLGTASSMLVAQTPASYRASVDTLRYDVRDPIRIYWLRGSDTVDLPSSYRKVEQHVWRRSANRLEVVARHMVLDMNRRIVLDTFTVSADGRVELINHKPPQAGAWTDVFPRVPSVPVAPGARWSDTINTSEVGLVGQRLYESLREYRAERVFDTLGTRMLDAAASGTVRIRLSHWVDSAAKTTAWIDVSGPVSERYLFDLTRGRLVRRAWTVHLRGRGVSPSGADTLPAEFRSRLVMELADGARVQFLLEPLRGADSSVTVSVTTRAEIQAHTVDRAADRITSSLVQSDGSVKVASVRYATDRPIGYDARWAGASSDMYAHLVAIRGQALVLTRAAVRDSTFPIPAPSWGIADDGMQELLAPPFCSRSRAMARHIRSPSFVPQRRVGTSARPLARTEPESSSSFCGYEKAGSPRYFCSRPMATTCMERAVLRRRFCARPPGPPVSSGCRRH